MHNVNEHTSTLYMICTTFVVHPLKMHAPVYCTIAGAEAEQAEPQAARHSRRRRELTAHLSPSASRRLAERYIVSGRTNQVLKEEGLTVNNRAT